MLSPNAKTFRPNTECNNDGPRTRFPVLVPANAAIKTTIKAASGGFNNSALVRAYDPSTDRFHSGPPLNAPKGPRSMTNPRKHNRTNYNTNRKTKTTNLPPSRILRPSRSRADLIATTILSASPPRPSAASLIFPFPPAPPSISQEESFSSVSVEDFEAAFDVDVNLMVDIACENLEHECYLENVEESSSFEMASVVTGHCRE
jgi:hypothetical protein